MSSHSPTKRSMETLRPVLESIFPEFDGGNTATLARGQATHVISGYSFYSRTHREKRKKIDDAESCYNVVELLLRSS